MRDILRVSTQCRRIPGRGCRASNPLVGWVGPLSVLLSLHCIFLSHVQAQISAWGSQSYGYSTNPLRTFAESGDRVAQSFIQLGYNNEYISSSPSLVYTGGLVLFDNFNRRDYYEQSLRGSVYLRFGAATLPHEIISDTTDSSEDEGESLPYADTLRPYLILAVKGTSRHDRDTVKAYDNQDVIVSGLYRSYLSHSSRLKISNDAEYRNYSFIHELSNVTNSTIAALEFDAGKSLTFGTLAGLSLKYYSSPTYDTSTFEPKRTFIPKATGKGKGGGLINNPHTKQILINPTTQRAVQIFAGFSTRGQWTTGSLTADLVYRINPGPTPRYLAQYASFSTIREDIYGDYMEYHGPECRIIYKQDLLFHLRSSISIETRSSTFSVPGLDLDGNQTASARKDLRSSVDLSLSRYFDLGSGFGIEIGTNGSILRNQSNDEYNDYALYEVSFEVGIGF